MSQGLQRIIRAPIFFIGLALSFVPALYIFGVVTVGAWFEDGLRRIGLPPRQEWLPLTLGLLGFSLLGVIMPAYLGFLLAGWPGSLAGPTIVLIVIGVLGRW